MAATKSPQTPGPLTLDDLAPALRKAAEACLFDLLPWIDLSQPVPRCPLRKDFDRFCHGTKGGPSLSGARTLLNRGDFFDASELTAPALQWSVWCLLRDGYSEHTVAVYVRGAAAFTAWLLKDGRLERDPLAGVNFSAWARGDLPDIKRLPDVKWESLRLYEKEGAPTYCNLAALLEARDDLPQADARERKRSLSNLSQHIWKARHVRESAPGTPFSQRICQGQSDEPGSFRAMCELFLLWRAVLQGRGLRYSRIVKSRWNQFPRTVMRAIAGPDVKYLRKYDSYHLLYERIHGRSRSRARSAEDGTGPLTRVEKGACGGGGKCPRNREFARRAERGESWADIFGWYVTLRPSQRADLCAVHTKLPASPRQVKKLALQATGPVQSHWIADLRADPVAGHQWLVNRKLRSFHNWCYETLKEAGKGRPVSHVVDAYSALSEAEQLARFGRVWPAGKPLTKKRREVYGKIEAAIAMVELELELGEQTEPPPPPPDDPELWHSESFREVRWGGDEYRFTTRQAACVRVMWGAAEGGAVSLHQDDILKQAASEASRLRDVFRPGKSRGKMDPAWGILVVSIDGEKGCYGLAPFLR